MTKCGIKLHIHSRLQRCSLWRLELISNFISHFPGHVITYPCCVWISSCSLKELPQTCYRNWNSCDWVFGLIPWIVGRVKSSLSMMTSSNGSIFRVTGQWRSFDFFSLICVWTNYWTKNGEAGDLSRYRAQYDVIVMPSANRSDAWPLNLRNKNKTAMPNAIDVTIACAIQVASKKQMNDELWIGLKSSWQMNISHEFIEYVVWSHKWLSERPTKRSS